MLETILDIAGAILINLGIFIMNTKYVKDPKKRIYASIILIIGCTATGTLMYMVGKPGTMFVQIGVIISNIYGIHNCRKEIKELRQEECRQYVW